MLGCNPINEPVGILSVGTVSTLITGKPTEHFTHENPVLKDPIDQVKRVVSVLVGQIATGAYSTWSRFEEPLTVNYTLILETPLILNQMNEGITTVTV